MVGVKDPADDRLNNTTPHEREKKTVQQIGKIDFDFNVVCSYVFQFACKISRITFVASCSKTTTYITFEPFSDLTRRH